MVLTEDQNLWAEYIIQAIICWENGVTLKIKTYDWGRENLCVYCQFHCSMRLPQLNYELTSTQTGHKSKQKLQVHMANQTN